MGCPVLLELLREKNGKDISEQDSSTERKSYRTGGLTPIFAGELFPRIGFIVPNLRLKSNNVVKFYNKRGTAEQWSKVTCRCLNVYLGNLRFYKVFTKHQSAWCYNDWQPIVALLSAE